MNFSLRNIIIGIVVLTLAVAIPVTVRLAQQQQQLKSKAEEAFTCFPIEVTAPNPSSAKIGDQVGIRVGGRTNDGNKMVSILVYVKGPDRGFIQLGQEVSCDSETCAGSVTWNSGALNNGPGSYTIAQRLINDLGGERNSDGNDTQCQKSYTLTESTPPPPPPPPAEGGNAGVGPAPVTVSGKVVNKVTNQGVQVTVNQDQNCNIGTKQTNSSTGVYSFNNVTPTANTFCLRLPGVAGFKDVETTTAGQRSYENLPANSSSNGSSYNFFLIPDDNARPSSFKIFQGSSDVTAGPIFTANSYTFEIRMVNNGNSVWKSGVYKLQPTGNTKSTWSLSDSYDWISPSGDVASGQEAVFSVSGTAPANPVGPPGTSFDVSMTNSQQNFGAGIQRLLQVQPAAGGPGASPPPDTGFRFRVIAGGSVQLIPGGPSKTTDVTVVREDNNTGAPSVTVTAIGFPSGVTFSFDEFAETKRSSRTCTPTIPSSCNLDLTMQALTSAPTSIITVRATHGEVSSRDEFGLVVGATTSAFNFSITKPSDVTLTKGQSDSGRDITISRTAGDAEDVSLSVIGDIGGAIAIFRPSDSCKPDAGNRCQRILAFDTSQATPGDYSPVIEGRGTGGRIQESLPFKLKINPLAATVTCFVVSENRNTRNLFKNCAQSTIDNVSNGVAGFLEDTSSLVDFQLSAQNGSKTLYARFLTLPQGESITTCSADKCKDTQAGITLNLVTSSPSPSPPPPVTGCGCQADACTSPCPFTKLTGVDYGLPPGTGPIQCSLPPAIHNIVPSSQDKNSWCNRQLRTTGDADGNGVKDENDYLYWLTAVNLGKVPVSVNPDFDGDGQIDADDLNIWRR